MRVSTASVCTFMLALVLVSISFQWDNTQLLPWTIRGIGIVCIVLALALTRTWRWPRTFDRWASVAERHPLVAVGLLSVLSLVTSLGLAYYVHDPFPHFADGFSYVFQAQIFATGRFFAPAPALPQFFEFDWIAIHDGRWFSIFPPGWPLILAAGVKLGFPAFVNPILGSLCVIVVYHLGTALFGPRHGLLAALFCCLSPFFLFMSAEFMSHTAALLFTSLSTLCHVKATRKRSGVGLFAWAGAAAAIAFLIRPVDALAIWTAQTAHGLWTSRSYRTLTGSLVSAAPLAFGIGLYSLYNRILVGTWFSSPLLLVSPRNVMGFGPDIGYDWATFATPGHSLWRALINLNYNAALMSQDLFGWPIPSLFFVVWLAMFGKKDSRHWLCGTVIAFSIAAYGLYWYHGVAFGARFYFTLLPYLLMLSVEGIRQTPQIIARFLPRVAPTAVSRLSIGLVSLCFVFGWTVYVPKVSLIGPYYNQKGVNNGFHDFQRSQRLDNAIVFVRAPTRLTYGPALLANELPLGKGVIYAFDSGEPVNQQLVAMFPGRSIHRYTYEPEANPWERRAALVRRLFSR